MSRLDLHNTLVGVLGSSNVYFQPPSTLVMKYPCIVYKRDGMISRRTDDSKLYYNKIGYMVTLIDQNPDSITIQKIMGLPLTVFDRHYTINNLNHDVFIVYDNK